MTRILVCTLALLSLSTGAFAQKDLARERVSLQFKDTPIAEVFPALAKSLGYELSLDPELRALITLQVENVTAQTALTAICESVGCRWRVADKRLIIEARPDVRARVTRADDQHTPARDSPFGVTVRTLDDRLPFDINWSPVDLNSAFVMLARMLRAEVDLAPALRGRRIAVSIQNTSMRQALDAVCGVGACRWELVEKPKRVVHVTERAGEAQAQRVYDKGEAGVRPPRVVSEAKPRYTREAMQAKIQGQVALSFVVQADGSVGDVEVVQSLEPGLDQEAVKAIRLWRFEPGTKDGRSVAVRVQAELTFTLR